MPPVSQGPLSGRRQEHGCGKAASTAAVQGGIITEFPPSAGTRSDKEVPGPLAPCSFLGNVFIYSTPGAD